MLNLELKKPMPDHRESERTRFRSSGECKPLLDVATKDLFRKNAFRITGLPIDATSRERAKHADKIKILAELGQDPHTQSAAFPIKPPPSLDEIREAIQNLKDPEKRLVDEFFWFWPEEFENSQSDPAMQALAKGDSQTAVEIWTNRENYAASKITAKHNLALVCHVCALDWENYSLKGEVEVERRQKIADYWKGAFTRWEHLATSEQFWEKVTARIRQLNEPNLPTGFVRRMRATLPEALDKINAELALAFAESGNIELARLHIRFMRETNQGLDNVEKTAALVLTPTKVRLREQIQRTKRVAEEDPAQANKAVRSLIEHAFPLIEVFDLFFGEQEHAEKEVLDETATACTNCLVSYQKKTDDNHAFIDLLRLTLPLAQAVDVHERIERNIEIGKTNILHDTLTPISSAPSLSTINGCGFTLYGHADEVAGSYLATYYFVLLGIPIFPICRYRVTSIGNQYRFLGKAPLRTFDKWHLAIFIIVINAAWIIPYVSSSGTAETGSYAGASTSSSPSTVSYSETPTSSSPDTRSGTVLSIPLSGLGTKERAEIENERATLEVLETELETLGQQIKRDRAYVDNTSQFAVDEFNAKVDRYRTLKQKLETANAAFNDRVDSYNARLSRDRP